MASIRKGDPAPDITLTVHTGEQVSLRGYQGQKAVVVYFYPKDETPICTREACAFRDANDDFAEAGAVVIGVSGDSDERHQAFVQAHRLPFLLASDADSRIRNAFGVPKTFGLLPGRVTYVIDREGIVQHVFNAQLLAEQHVKEALDTVRTFS